MYWEGVDLKRELIRKLKYLISFACHLVRVCLSLF